MLIYLCGKFYFWVEKKNECHVQTSGSIYKIIHRSQLTTQ
jgi:hypothetical protein